MKKGLIVILGIVTAFVVVELLIRYVAGYPTLGPRKAVVFYPGLSGASKVYLYKPNSVYVNVEAGYRRFRRNNIGVHGPDSDLSEDSNLIFLAGSSYIEAYQVRCEETAAAIFDRKLNNLDKHFSVLNLGASGHDPYLAYLRVKLFTKLYRSPDKVVLAIENMRAGWLSRYKTPLDFSLPPRFGEPHHFSKIRFIVEKATEVSSAATIFFNLLKNMKDEQDTEIEEVPATDIDVNSEFTDELKSTLLQFQHDFGDDFLLVSFDNDARENKMLEDFCEENGIHFYSDESVLQPKNCFNGAGHLNVEGNKKLGELLEKAFSKTYPNRQKKA